MHLVVNTMALAFEKREGFIARRPERRWEVWVDFLT